MKKIVLGIVSVLILIFSLSGCDATNGEKTASFLIIYAIAAVFSLLLLISCLILVRKKRHWFIFLFASVLTVNIGYTILSVSPNLSIALWANRISYLGSVFLPLSMLMIILSATNTNYKRWLPLTLFGISALIFLIAASPGICDIYYKNVSLVIVNGVSTLKKVYGPLHITYFVYLLGYFAAMVAIIIRASVKKTIENTTHSVIIAIAVLVNIGVWLIEQLVSINFEMLSISYIISELFLMGIHLVIKENQRLKSLILQKDEALSAIKTEKSVLNAANISSSAIKYFTAGLETLTPTERKIFNAYLKGNSTKKIMSTLNIKENTLKFHNKNIYGKLGVSSRKELLTINRAIEMEKLEKQSNY